MTIFTVAITGGIAAGKTAATAYFSNLGVPVLDADIVAKDITSDKAVIATIADHFGTEILNADNSLNRSKLRSIIFQNKADKLWLEELLHPKIRDAIIAKKSELSSSFCIVALPLIHSDSRKIYGLDMICSLISNKNLRMTRLIKRDNIRASEASAIISSQMSDKEIIALSDTVITNNADLAALEDNIKQLHKLILQQLKCKPEHK